MTKVKLLLADRRRRQRGSVLSGVLIIVAMLSILIGALMTELSSSFLVSRSFTSRMEREATVTSAVELGINQLQNSAVPPVCVRDSRGPWYLTLNGNPAAITQMCTAIVPDEKTGLASGSFVVDGVHDTTSGRDRYIVSDSSGTLRAYQFGQTAPSWSKAIGGAPTGALLTKTETGGSVDLLIPAAIAGSSCAGHCVALFNDSGGTPNFVCNMPANSVVTARPAAEVTAGTTPHFPDYAFFASSGPAGTLYVYNADDEALCAQLASAALGGGSAEAPLVFPGTFTKQGSVTTVNDEIFVMVSNGNNTNLQHWRYGEATDSAGNTTSSLSQVGSLLLTSQVGGIAAGYAINTTVPATGTNLTLAVVGTSGKVAKLQIAVGSGPSYTMSTLASATLPGGVSRAPYWCHCPSQDLIGAGSTNGFLYLLDTNLNVAKQYDGQADGRPAINSTPAADANGDWYFGADDGYVYDVEIPATGTQMFKAAKFGPGGAIRSSPVVGRPSDGCSPGACLYFGSSTQGSYFVQLGNTRIMDLRSCVSTAPGSVSCAANPRLWARVTIGSPAVVGGRGISVQGWSYYSP